MRFLLIETDSERVTPGLEALGHRAVQPGDLGLPLDPAASDPGELLKACRDRQHEILTSSAQVLEAILPRSGRREVFGRTIVYLHDPGDAAEAVERLFLRYKRLSPGRLYTVTTGKVKVRQLPARSPDA